MTKFYDSTLMPLRFTNVAERSRISRLKRQVVRFRPFIALATLALATSLVQAGETTNKIGITMVDIPAGSFLMGSCKLKTEIVEENKKRAFLGQDLLPANCSNPVFASDNETPQHRVNVKSFQMGKTEVTLGQFKKFIAAAGRADLVNDEFMKHNAYGDKVPVLMVSWFDAQDFIKWLNQTEGGGYRLPSEAEWEYACRAGGQHTYCGGNNLNVLGWHAHNSGMRPRPVGGKRANAFGLFDMSGNAAEWVQDCWHNNYIGAPTDGGEWTTNGECKERVYRSGLWNYIDLVARAAYRGRNAADGRFSATGFRLARDR